MHLIIDFYPLPTTFTGTFQGIDEEYDQALREFFFPYHQFVDMLCRVAINYDSMTEVLVNLSMYCHC